MSHSSRKALYIFLSCLLGSILFLILHRLAVFVYMMLLESAYSVFSFGFRPLELMAIDYLTLLLAMLFGGWYGIWIGLYWYDAVYEKGHRGGFVDHLAGKLFGGYHAHATLDTRIMAATRKIEQDLVELESIADTVKVRTKKPTPIKRTTVRKRAVAKKA